MDINYELTNTLINNKNLNAYYSKKNHSIWEMSLIREKNPLKIPKIYTMIKYLACIEIINDFKKDQISFELNLKFKIEIIVKIE